MRAIKTVSWMVILRSEMRNKTLPSPPLKGGNPKSPFKTPSGSPLKGEYPKSPFKGDLEGRGGAGRVF